MNFLNWIKLRYKRIINSIAFLPSILIVLFLLLTWLMLQFDFSQAGQNLKSTLSWLTLKDASTARSIISSIVAGVISLTVFSFSMVMLILNQAASQMSNRVLNHLIEDRFQQTVLGFYIGTIVYALFLLTVIRDTDTGIHVPALSTYLLIAFTVTDIFLFIYFLHFITQSIKYDTIIGRIYEQTHQVMQETFVGYPEPLAYIPHDAQKVAAPVTGIYQGFEKKTLLAIAKRHGACIYFLQVAGSFVLQGTPILSIRCDTSLADAQLKEILHAINIQRGEDILSNYYYGFRQLKEVALKALSPGINDPGTAVISLQALTGLLAFRLKNFPETVIIDEQKTQRVIVKHFSFDEIFTSCVLPIWDYGKKDRTLQNAFLNTLMQLENIQSTTLVNSLLKEINAELLPVPHANDRS